MPNNEDTSIETLKKVLNITYHRNLAALEKSFPNFYQRFKDYTPTEFALEMDGDGNLNIAGKEGFLYQENPQELCKNQVDAFASCPIRSIYNLNNIDPKNAAVYFEHISFIHEIVQEAEKLRAEESKDKYEAPECYPFMCVIGVGMGYHLEHLAAENISHLYVYEPHNDVFYASLFVVDYAHLIHMFTQSNKAITFDIGSTPDKFTENLYSVFIERGAFRSASLPVYKHYDSETADEALKKFIDNASKFYSGFGFFEDEIISINHTFKNLKNGIPVVPKELDWHGEEDKPVFICGNGPSLDSCIDFLKANEGKYYLFSCGSALSPLYKAGLTPDLHFETERTVQLYDWVASLDDKEYFSKVTVVAMNTVAPEVISLFGKAFIYMKPNDGGTELLREAFMQHFGKAMFPFASNPLVGNGALAFSAFAGFKNIYLAGLDAGFKDPDYHHSKNSAYYGKFKDKYATKDSGLKKVPGNFEESVYTNFIFEASKHGLEYILKRPAFKDIKCFNCSDGIKVEGAEPQRIEGVSLQDMDKKDLGNILGDQALRDYFDVTTLEDKLLSCSRELFDMIEVLAPPELKGSEPTLQQLIDIYTFQHNYNREQASQGKIFAARMLAGSINYLQAPTVGKMYLLYTDHARKELAKKALSVNYNYFKKMKKLYETDVLSMFNDKTLRKFFKQKKH
ncbi:6-hydroxymethylpterin diphosphokinase MptE-like protein [Colwelliaceae bacterium 6471]